MSVLSLARLLPATAADPIPSASSRPTVVIVQDDNATDAFQPDAEIVRILVQRGLTNFTQLPDVKAAWLSLVRTQDVIGIKVFSAPGPQIGTRLPVVAGVIEGLLGAGVPPHHIVVWDRQLSDLRRAGFSELTRRYGVKLAGSVDAGWDTNSFYESSLIGQLVFGDLEFPRKGDNAGRKSYVSKLLTSHLTKIINISPLLNHNTIGVCGNLYSLAMGSVDNTLRFEGDPSRLAQAVPEIYALPGLGDRVTLNIVDALICQYQGENVSRLHDSYPLNQLRFSTDPVVLDVLSVQEINAQRLRAAQSLAARTNRFELYRNAALMELGLADTNRMELRQTHLND